LSLIRWLASPRTVRRTALKPTAESVTARTPEFIRAMLAATGAGAICAGSDVVNSGISLAKFRCKQLNSRRGIVVSEDLQRYSAVAAALHWAIAILIIFNLGFGFFMEGFKPPFRFLILALHISSGITVLGLTVVRIAWRLTHRPPPLVPGLSPLESGAAHTVHFLLYTAMLFMPLTGWSILSAHPPNPHFPKMSLWFTPIHLPAIGPIANLEPHFQAQMHTNFVSAHTVGGYTLLALLLLHVAGALKHQFVDGHREFARMGFGRAS